MKMIDNTRRVAQLPNALELPPHRPRRGRPKKGASRLLIVRVLLLLAVITTGWASMAFGTTCAKPAQGVAAHSEPAILNAHHRGWADVVDDLDAIDDEDWLEGLGTTGGHQTALLQAKSTWRNIYQVLADNSQHINDDGTIAPAEAANVRAAVHGHLNTLAQSHQTLLGTAADAARKKAFATLSYLNDNLMITLPTDLLTTYQPPTAGVASAELAAGYNAVRAGARWFAMNEAARAALVPGTAGANPAWAVAARWYPNQTVRYGEPGLNLRAHAGSSITDGISREFYEHYGLDPDTGHLEFFQPVPIPPLAPGQPPGSFSIAKTWTIRDGHLFAQWLEYRWEHDRWANDTYRVDLQPQLKDRVAYRTDALNTASQNSTGHPHRYRSQGAGMPYLHGEQSAINNVPLAGIAADGTSPVHLSVHTFGSGGSFNNCTSCSSTLDGYALSTTGGGPYGTPSHYTR